MKREKKLILDYGIGSVTYTDIRNFKIQYPYIVIDGENVSLVGVKFVKYKNFVAWIKEDNLFIKGEKYG